MDIEEPRSRSARSAAERALIRISRHYGAEPEFVVLGGLVPDLLCAGSAFTHAGTTDVDVQVDLEIACGAVNTARLEMSRRMILPLTSRLPHAAVLDGALLFLSDRSRTARSAGINDREFGGRLPLPSRLT